MKDETVFIKNCILSEWEVGNETGNEVVGAMAIVTAETVQKLK